MSADRRCTARSKRSGEQCKHAATPGATVCRMHGSGAPQVKAAAQRRLHAQIAREECERLGLAVEIDPGEALLRQVWESAGVLAFYRTHLADIHDPLESEHSEGLLALYNQERRHLVAVSAAALRAGVEQRRVEIEEQKGELIATLFRQVLADPELGLTADAQTTARAVAARHLRLVTGGQ